MQGIAFKSRAAAVKTGWLVRNKELLGALQALVTIIGLFLAFVWFQGQHQTVSKIKIEQAFAQRPYTGPGHLEGEILLSVQVWLTNVGSVSDYLEPGRIRIDEVNPDARRLYCDVVLDIDKFVPCEKAQSREDGVSGRTAGFIESLQRSTILGWFWRPRSSSRWIESGEKDQAVANIYRLARTTKTIRVSSIWSVGNRGFWKAIDFVDLSDPASLSVTPTVN